MTTSNVKIEGWEQLAEVLGIMRGGDSKESVPSVVLKTTASNAVQVEVKIYNPNPQQAKDDCIAIFDEVRVRYGLA